MQSIKHQGAQGVNYVEDVLPLNVSPYSLNVDTSRGLWSKRKGKNSIITTLGTGQVHSMHTGKTSTGDKLLAGHDTSLYSLTGSDDTIIKTTTADFTAGTLTDTVADDNVEFDVATLDDDCASDPTTYGWVLSGEDPIISEGGSYIAYYGDYYANGYITKTFDSSYETMEAVFGISFTTSSTPHYITIYMYDSSDNEVMKFNYYNNSQEDSYHRRYAYVEGSTVYTSSISEPDPAITSVSFIKNGSSVSFKENDTVVGTGTTTKEINKVKIYLYNRAVAYASVQISDIDIKLGHETTGTYISQALDLTQTPSACTLDYNDTTSGSQTVFMYVSSSEDNITYSDYILASNGGNLPHKRYLKIKAILTSDVFYTTPSLDDYTVSYTTNADTTTEIDTGLTGNTIRFMNYDGRTYYAYGDYPKYWDGTTTKVLGNGTIPTNTTTLAAGATGLLNGDYYYKITYVDSDGVEGNPSVATAMVTVTNKKVVLSSVPVSSGMTRRIYRTVASGIIYYLVDEIDDDTTTTYTDNYSDTTIQDATKIVQTDNYVPPKCDLIYQHKNYYFYVDATDNSILWFSKVYGTSYDHPLGAFEQVPLTNFKKLPNDIKAIATYENKLIVSGEGFTGFYTGDIWGGTSDNTAWYPIDSIGALNQEGISLCQTQSGSVCAIFTGGGIRYLVPGEYETALQRLPLTKDIQPYVDGWVTTDAGLFFYNSILYVSFTYYEDTPVDYQNVIFAFDFKRNIWDGPWDFKISSAAVYNKHIYGGDSRSGLVYEMFTGSTDNGEDIHMICDLVGDMGRYKTTLQKIKVQATTESEPEDMYIRMDVDENNKSMATGAKSTWRQTVSNYSQNLMEKVLWVRKRGTFYNLRIDDESTNPIEIKSIVVEYEGVKE